MIYAVSDIHGQYRLFTRLLQKINFSKNDVLYVLGDIIDRGPNSIKLLQYIMKRPNIHCLLGNHEHMMWADMKEYIRDVSGSWLNPANGGYYTREQFGKLSVEDQNNIWDYISNMNLQTEISISDKTFLLSHSSFIFDEGTIPWKSRDNYDVIKVVWTSPWRFYEYTPKEYYNRDNRIHIIGHVPVQNARMTDMSEELVKMKEIDKDAISVNSDKLEALCENNIINIDGGCAGIPNKTWKNAGLICINLNAYVNGEDCFTYIHYKD